MKQRLWAAIRDTHGHDRESSAPLATLLAAHPALRTKAPAELASMLGITRVDAEHAIASYVHDATPPELARTARRGVSAEARMVDVGRPAPAAWVRPLDAAGGAFVTRGDARSREDAGGFNDTDFGAVPLPIGYAYRVPNRLVYDPGEIAAYQNGTAGMPSPVRVDPPTGFDVQVATILRGPIAPDPNDPTLPEPAAIRAFVFAMRPSGVGLVTNANGELAAHPGGVLPDGSDPATLLASYARGAKESDPAWPAPLPGEGWDLPAIRKAFDAFRWYGPLPGDVETPDGVKYYDGWGDGITRERYVFWYAIDDDGNWNRCMQVQGWNGKEWTLPTKWSEYLRAWQWRPSDASNPNNVGDWRVFFSFSNFVNENKGTFAAVAFWVSSIIITVSTLGAGAATIAAAATVSAVLIAAQKLYAAALANDPAKTVAAIVEFGKAVNGASGGDLVGAIKRDHPTLAAFASDVAAPFEKIYTAAGGAMGTIQTLWQQANALRSQVPPIGNAAWGAAMTALGASGGATTGPAAWLAMARLPTSGEVADELWKNAPSWAKDVVALGVALTATELAQASNRATAVRALANRPSGGGGSMVAAFLSKGQGYVQIAPETVATVRSIWKVPPPPTDPPPPSFIATSAEAPTSAAVPIVAAAGLGLAWLLGFLR